MFFRFFSPLRAGQFLVIAVFLLAVAMLTLPMSMACAKNNLKFIDVSGQTIIYGGGDLVFTPAGDSGNAILVVSGNSVEWTGGIAGTGSADGHFLLHDYGTPDTWMTMTNVHTLDAEFGGKSGTLTIMSNHGFWTIISGTGGFANCHGQGKIWAIMAPVLWGYEGTIHFDP
jgi:hypothetical protein